MTTDKITDEAQAALDAFNELVDAVFRHDKHAANGDELQRHTNALIAASQGVTLARDHAKTIRRALQRSDMQFPDLPDGWELYCVQNLRPCLKDGVFLYRVYLIRNNELNDFEIVDASAPTPRAAALAAIEKTKGANNG